MKLKFKQQPYQADATDAVVRLFSGQSKGYRKDKVGKKGMLVEEIFSNKTLDLSDGEIIKNLREIQKEQGLPESKVLDRGKNFTVEMETGTGKTYVYTKTMFELNKQYGWNKFIIMVPSVAIREGVHKSLEITAEHFQEIYGKKIRFSIYNTQNKSNLRNITNFADTANIEVIIMNYQAFATKSKESRKIYQKLDQTGSIAPIDIIKRANPILIIDEPQRFGDTAEKLLPGFNPLFTLRYSATHKKDRKTKKEFFNKVYRLDAIDAYNQKLVKKIKVKGIEVVNNTGTNSYIFLDKINISQKSYPTAVLHMEFEVKGASGIRKKLKKVKEGDDLYVLSGELEQYKGFVVKEINGLTNHVSFLNGVEIFVGQAIGNVEEHHIRRIQIRETIKSHLEKERDLYQKGIKVLSLFFIDEVAKYRKYDENGNHLVGQAEYEQMFEEEYEQILSQRELLDDEYNAYLDKHNVRTIHNGYFSIDKKGKFVNALKNTAAELQSSTDASAYDLIMKDKERLLSFDEPTRFIFSHSALREGWDNPNVFQICTLKQGQQDDNKRQEIGRGLRIAVNNKGERMDHAVLEEEFFEVNSLTVVASESYKEFSNKLQKEIVEALSARPRKLTVEALQGRILKNKEDESFTFDTQNSMDLIFAFKMKGYIDADYKITELLIDAIDKEELELPETLQPFTDEVSIIMKEIYATDNFKASEDAKADNVHIAELKPNDNFAKKEFQDLWNKIKTKTVYEVDFDTEELVINSVQAINSHLEVKKVVVNITSGEQSDSLSEEKLRSGESIKKTLNQAERTESILGSVRYDLIAEIAKGANITRKTVVSILSKINADKFEQFKMNPEHFIHEIIRFINEQKAATLISNITYEKTDQSYDNKVFTVNNFQGSLKDNVMHVQKHIYDYVKTDSHTEKIFAENLETGNVLVYAKLPSGFKIPTPVGNYNPDWAVVFDTENTKYIYFIAETKGSMSTLQLKHAEDLKIQYARKHFEALGNSDVKYDVVHTYEDLCDKIMK